MKIALYNSFNGHFEVIGYIMELFSKDNNSITLYHNNGDRFGYIDYFEVKKMTKWSKFEKKFNLK